MKPAILKSQIDAAFVNFFLPCLTREQFADLAASEHRSMLESWFERAIAGDATVAPHLRLLTRAAGKEVADLLQMAGFEGKPSALLGLAIREGDRLFGAIERSAEEGDTGFRARCYLESLGLARARDAEPPYETFHVYGAGAALTFSEALSRSEKVPTIQIDGALRLQSGNRSRYDWANKIVFQLSNSECYRLLAVMLGKVPTAHFKNHGKLNDKALEVVDQADGTYVKLIQRGKPAVHVPITPEDGARVLTLLYRQLVGGASGLTHELVDRAVENLARKLRNSTRLAG